MKKCLLLCASLFLYIETSDGMGYGQGDGGYYNQPNMMQQQGYDPFMQGNAYEQGGMPMQGNAYGQGGMPMQGNAYGQGGMPMQGNAYGQGGMPMQGDAYGQAEMPMQGNMEQYPDNLADNREYVHSLVNDVLGVSDKPNNNAAVTFEYNQFDGQTIPPGGVMSNNSMINKARLENQINKIRRDLDDLNQYLGINKEQKNKAKGKATNKKQFKGKSKKRYNKIRKSWTRLGRFNATPRRYYTVKRLNAKNASEYIPRYRSYGYTRSSLKSGVTVSSPNSVEYKVKNWGTGEVSSISDHYSHQKYFSNKSNCKNGCGS